MSSLEAVSKSKGAGYALLCAVIVLGAGLRLYSLGAKSLWYDEACIIVTAQELDSPRAVVDTTRTTDPPVFPLLLRAWFAGMDAAFDVERTSEESDFLIRLLPCIAGILAIPILFLTCRAVTGDERTALIASYLYALSPFQVYYAQEVRTYTVYTVLSLFAVYALVKALEGNRARHWLALVLLLALLVYDHYVSVWTIACLNLYFVVTLKAHWPRLHAWIVSQSALLLLLIPALILIWTITGYFDNIQYTWYVKPTLKTAFITFKTFFAGYSPSVLAYWTLFLTALGLFCIGCYGLRRHWSRLSLLVILAVVPIVGNVIVWNIKEFPLYEHRLFVFSGVVAYFLVASGIRTLPTAWASGAALALLSVVTLPCLGDHYAHRLHPVPMHRIGVWDKVDFRAAARTVNEQFEDGDIVGHPGHFGWYSFSYYCNAPQYILGHGREERAAMVNTFGNEAIIKHFHMLPEPIQTLAEKAKRIWFLEPHGITFTYPPAVVIYRAWLEAHGFQEDYAVFDGVTLTCYRMDPDRRGRALGYEIADLGEAPLSHYRVPGEKAGAASGLLDRAPPLLATFHDTPAVRFDVGTVQGDILTMSGAAEPVEWIDQDGDAAPDGLLLVGPGQEIALGGAAVIGGAPYSLLGMDGAGKRALLASFPLVAEDDFAYRFVVVNPTGVARALDCTIYESAAVVPAVAYLRDDPLTSVWGPRPQYDPGPPPTVFLAPAMTAHVQETSGEGEVIHASVRLAPGSYKAFARIQESPVSYPQSRAQVQFAIGPPAQPLARLDGLNREDTHGWSWRSIGELKSTGSVLTLAMAPYNANGYSDAYFQVDRVLFAREPVPEGDTPFIADRFPIALEPHEEKAFTIEGSLGHYPRKRVDIEVFEPAAKSYRTLTFHVDRASRE